MPRLDAVRERAPWWLGQTIFDDKGAGRYQPKEVTAPVIWDDDNRFTFRSIKTVTAQLCLTGAGSEYLLERAMLGLSVSIVVVNSTNAARFTVEIPLTMDVGQAGKNTRTFTHQLAKDVTITERHHKDDGVLIRVDDGSIRQDLDDFDGHRSMKVWLGGMQTRDLG